MCRSPEGYGSISSIVELVARLGGPGRRFATSKARASSQTRCHFASIDLWVVRVQFRLQKRKSLSSERPWELDAAPPRCLPELREKLLHLCGLYQRYRRVRGGRMAGYTTVNLKRDVEDQAPKFGSRPSSRFRMRPRAARARELRRQLPAASRRTCASPSGTGTTVQEEVYVLVSGSARLKVDDEVDRAGAAGRDAHPPGDDAEARGRARGRRADRVGAPNTGPGDAQVDARLVDGLS